MHVYITSEPGLYTVGHYAPNGEWVPESDWDNADDAAKQVSYLNGGFNLFHFLTNLRDVLTTLKQQR